MSDIRPRFEDADTIIANSCFKTHEQVVRPLGNQRLKRAVIANADITLSPFDPWPSQRNLTFAVGSGKSFLLHYLMESGAQTSTNAEPNAFADFSNYGKANWDGEGALPITPITVFAARIILVMLPTKFGNPHIAPGADGTIGFEWIQKAGTFVKLYIDIGPGFYWSAYWRKRNGQIGKRPRIPIKIPDMHDALLDIFKQLSA
jgi:hypothetical protein